MELEERKIKQAEAIQERRERGKEQPITPRDYETCEKRGYGKPVAKFKDEGGMVSIFCSLE